MSLGIINSVPGGAYIKHPTTNWWTPAGFFRQIRESKDKHYARVWKYHWITEGLIKVSDEPVGVVILNDLTLETVVKVGWKWLGYESGKSVTDTIQFEFISKAEYETDLAFGLFKKLRVKHRPILSWYKRHKKRIRKWNMIATLLSATTCFQLLANTTEPWDFWIITGTLLAAYACVSLLWTFATADMRGKR